MNQTPAAAPSKNYMTPSGFQRLREELHELLHTKRPEMVRTVSWAASNGDRSENGDYIYGKRRLREIDRRIRFLQGRLDQSEVVDPAHQKGKRVLFGATVTLVDEQGDERVLSIVGIDEANPAQGQISWISPLAKSLLGAEEGAVIRFRAPKSPPEGEELEILKVEFKAIQVSELQPEESSDDQAKDDEE